MSNKNIIIKDVDLEVLRALYKFDFLSEKQLAIIVGENPCYIKQRLKKLRGAGLIERKVISNIAVNFLTIKGMQEAGLIMRRTHIPTVSIVSDKTNFA